MVLWGRTFVKVLPHTSSQNFYGKERGRNHPAPFPVRQVGNLEYKIYIIILRSRLGGGPLKERKKPGPPPEKPLEHDLKVRVSQESLDKIQFCMDQLNLTRSEVLRRGVLPMTVFKRAGEGPRNEQSGAPYHKPAPLPQTRHPQEICPGDPECRALSQKISAQMKY